jgi:hypothetical protein
MPAIVPQYRWLDMELLLFAASAFFWRGMHSYNEETPPEPAHRVKLKKNLHEVLSRKTQSRAALPQKRKVSARQMKAQIKAEKKSKKVHWISRIAETARYFLIQAPYIISMDSLVLFYIMAQGCSTTLLEKFVVDFRNLSILKTPFSHKRIRVKVAQE